MLVFEKIACKDKDFLRKLYFNSEKNVIFAANLVLKPVIYEIH